MASNGNSTVLILYKVMNTESDSSDPLFNCFPIPKGPKGPTLKAIKQKCHALHALNHLGPEGYHWRVCMEDKPLPGSMPSDNKTFSWWDVQDENAVLPVKEATQFELSKFFSPPSSSSKDESAHDAATRAAKGAFKSLGKVVTSAVTGGGGDGMDGPPVSVVAFKLLDLVKMQDDFTTKNNGRGGGGAGTHTTTPAATAPRHHHQQQPHQQQQQRTAPAARTAAPVQQQQHQPARTPAPQPQYAPPRPAAVPTPAARPAAPPPKPAAAAEPSLMDFGTVPAPPRSGGINMRNLSSSSSFSSSTPESRAEKLKREYEEKNRNANRVWDDIDQRWVDTCPKEANSASGGLAAATAKKHVGISLDPSNAIGKSAEVQDAVNKRVNDMRESQQKALEDLRQREMKKKVADAEEDVVRQKLEPKIKAWSEEYGKKKQLRALLASLHTILWAGAEWKQISIGDVMDDGKLKRFYFKASRVVHPDKTVNLGPEERFLAKRIFDALSQAKTEFDNGTR